MGISIVDRDGPRYKCKRNDRPFIRNVVPFIKRNLVPDQADEEGGGRNARGGGERRMRADALRNLDTLLQAAKTVFATSGVDAPVREIAEQAGVGVGTVYRHFPQRSDLIAAVFRREMDACADAAPVLAAEHAPFEALANWLQRYAVFVGTKRGLAAALHSGDQAFEALPAHFEQRLRPAFRALFEAAVAAGDVRADVDANEVLSAIASLCMSAHHTGPGYAQRMVALLVDGLRRGPKPD
jgi:AcrR family transcriptional regulator